MNLDSCFQRKSLKVVGKSMHYANISCHFIFRGASVLGES